MKDKLRVGIIGTGGIAHAHANAYKQFADVEIVAGADIIPGKARKFLDEFGWTDAAAYETHEELCARDDIDAVSVCTYNSQHAGPTICALHAGKDVLLEKPMCVTLEEAKAIRAAEQETGHFVTVGFQPRYGENVKKVKEVVESGVLGKIYYIVVGGGRVKGIPGSTFIEKDKAAVGCVGDIGCYGLDFALNSIGYPKPLTVSAKQFAYFGKNPAKYKEANRFTVDDDFAVAMIRCEGDIVIDYRASWAMNMDTTGDSLFFGTDAGLKVKAPVGCCWDGAAGDLVLYKDDENGNQVATPIPVEGSNIKRNMFEQKVRAFVDACLGDHVAPIPTSQIIYNQAIIDGIIRSSACGHEVEINL